MGLFSGIGLHGNTQHQPQSTMMYEDYAKYDPQLDGCVEDFTLAGGSDTPNNGLGYFLLKTVANTISGVARGTYQLYTNMNYPIWVKIRTFVILNLSNNQTAFFGVSYNSNAWPIAGNKYCYVVCRDAARNWSLETNDGTTIINYPFTTAGQVYDMVGLYISKGIAYVYVNGTLKTSGPMPAGMTQYMNMVGTHDSGVANASIAQIGVSFWGFRRYSA